jgi:hypothetical protein
MNPSLVASRDEWSTAVDKTLIAFLDAQRATVQATPGTTQPARG